MLSQANRNELSTFSYWMHVVWPWSLVVLAWSILFLASSTNGLALLDHDYLINSGRLPWLVALGLFLVSWQIMTVAMMLPSTCSILSTMVLADSGQRFLWLRQLLFLSGYGLVWTLFALAAFLGDTLLHQLVNHWLWLYQHSWLIGTLIFALAGAIQFSPFKRYYLQRCCDSAITCVWNEPQAAWRFGWRYGWFCLGSCWALMLVMFAVGGRNLLGMALLALALLLEKLAQGANYVRVGIGVGFLLLAAAWLVVFL
ncbi:MAG TPA: DUF2182 domain-containing protein [Ktedonosporobacter sp.]|nr:DUF2182 domain-containing protein [Ktedonosporobacter sp.]